MNQYQKLKLDRNCVYIFKDCNLEVIVHCDDGTIVGESLLQQSDPAPVWSCYCLTDLGHVYRVTSTQAKHGIRQADQEDNQEIFSDLLVTNATEEEEEDEHGVSVCPSPRRPVYILQPRNRVLSLTQTPVAICVLHNLLSVVTDVCDKHSVYMYEIAEKFKDDVSVSKQAKVLECRKHFLDSKDRDKSCKAVIKAAVLNSEAENAVDSTDQITLVESLFKELLGKDAFLLNVPVILLALPEGAIYYASTKSFMFLATSQLGFEALNSEHCKTSLTDDDMQVDQAFKPLAATRGSVVANGNNTPPGGSWRMLCDTASPVVDIVQVSLLNDQHVSVTLSPVNSESEVGHKDTLVVCCRSGLVLVYFTDRHDKSVVRVSKIMVTSPMVAVNSFGNRIYLSTGLQINETSLFLKHGKKDRNKFVAATETKIFKYAGVLALLCCPEEGYISHQDSPCQLTCATSQGQIKVIKSTDLGSNVTEVTGSQIRDILLAMDSVDAEKRAIQKVLQDQDQLLQQVNIALNLVSQASLPCEGCSTSSKNLLNAPHKVTMSEMQQDKPRTMLNTPQKSCPLCCYTTARTFSAHGENRLQLDVNVTNHIGVGMSCDWRFVATVSPRSTTAEQHNNSYSVSQTLHQEFKPEELLSLNICVKPKMVLQGCTVSVTAMLCLKDTFDWLDSDTPLSYRSEKVRCLSAPIYREEINVLHFLMPNTYESKQVVEGKDTTAVVRRSILKIAEKKPMRNVYKDNISKDPAFCSTVCLSHVSHMSQQTYEQLQTRYSKGACSVLQYLLQTSPCVLPPSSPDCSLVTMLGQPVFLTIVTRMAANMAATLTPGVAMETKVVTVEVKVRAEAATAAAVHSAVSKRMKGLEREACHPPVHIKDLKKNLHHLQDLQEELQSMPVNHEDTSKLTSLYEKLRSIHVA